MSELMRLAERQDTLAALMHSFLAGAPWEAERVFVPLDTIRNIQRLAEETAPVLRARAAEQHDTGKDATDER